MNVHSEKEMPRPKRNNNNQIKGVQGLLLSKVASGGYCQRLRSKTHPLQGNQKIIIITKVKPKITSSPPSYKYWQKDHLCVLLQKSDL